MNKASKLIVLMVFILFANVACDGFEQNSEIHSVLTASDNAIRFDSLNVRKLAMAYLNYSDTNKKRPDSFEDLISAGLIEKSDLNSSAAKELKINGCVYAIRSSDVVAAELAAGGKPSGIVTIYLTQGICYQGGKYLVGMLDGTVSIQHSPLVKK